MQDQLPAAPVDAHVMVELAYQDAVLHRSLAAVSLVPQVVHVAADRRAAASGPGALLVAEYYCAADVGRDGVAVALLCVLYL